MKASRGNVDGYRASVAAVRGVGSAAVHLAAAAIVALVATSEVSGQVIPPATEQIAAAVLPLPAAMRASATVLGYGANGELTSLRKGTGAMTCLARDPKAAEFHVACYHNSLEPFMARGRELRAKGVTGTEVDSVRFREAKAGTLKLPTGPASLYSLTGGNFDPKTGTATGARPVFVVYMPYATSASTGLPDKPAEGPWLMFAGTPKAHIMFVPRM